MHLVDITVGVLAALISSVLWMVALPVVLGPRLEIKEEIRQYVSRAEQDAGKTAYRMYIRNRRRRGLIDLRYELTLRYRLSGERSQISILERQNNGPLTIPGKSRGDDGSYGLSFHLDILRDLDRVTSEPGFESCELRLRLFVRDEMSGVGKIFQRDFPREAIALLSPARQAEEQLPVLSTHLKGEAVSSEPGDVTA